MTVQSNNENTMKELVTFLYGLYIDRDLIPFALFPTSELAEIALNAWVEEYPENEYSVKKLEKDVTYTVEMRYTKVAKVY